MPKKKYGSVEEMTDVYNHSKDSGHVDDDTSYDEWKYNTFRSDANDYTWNDGPPLEASQKDIDDYYFNYQYGDENDDDDDD